jgi:hypothetical protein
MRRADDSGCPEDAEEGNAVGMRDLCVCTRRRHERSSHALGDASFARSSDPCTSILTMLRRRKPPEVGRAAFGHHGWASPRKWEEPALGPTPPDGARLAACHRFRKGEGVTRRRKGRRSRSPSLRGSQGARVWLPARCIAVAEVGRRRLVSNKLGIRAPKRAVRVELTGA